MIIHYCNHKALRQVIHMHSEQKWENLWEKDVKTNASRAPIKCFFFNFIQKPSLNWDCEMHMELKSIYM